MLTSTPTSMLPSEKLLLDGGEKLLPEDTTRYRSVVGVLQYLSLTRPDISFCVNRVYQFMSSQTSVHCVNRVSLACVLQSPALIFLVHSRMLIGPGILMTVEALEAMRFFVGGNIIPGFQGNNQKFLVLVRRPNTRQLMMPLPN